MLHACCKPVKRDPTQQTVEKTVQSMTLFGTPDIFYNFMSDDQGCSGVGTRSHTFLQWIASKHGCDLTDVLAIMQIRTSFYLVWERRSHPFLRFPLK